MRYRRRKGLRGDRSRGESGGSVDRTAAWKRWGVTAAVAAALFVVGYVVADLWLTPGSRTADAGPLVTVPELVGLTNDEAKGRLEQLGLEYGIRSTVAHARAPEGAVLAQSPIPGQQVRPGAPVEVTLSRGPESHEIPDVAGLSERQASILLERLGFRVTASRATHAFDAGRAIGTEPGPGIELSVPSEVTLLVSDGPALTTVPDLTGRHIDDALRLLSDAGLALGAISYDPLASDAPGRIVGQYPPGGYGLRRGDPVEVRVAGRPESVNRSRSVPPEQQDPNGSGEI